MILPIKVEIGCADLTISFSVGAVDFVVPPSAGDPVQFRYDGWPESIIGIVKHVYHITGSTVGCMPVVEMGLADRDSVITAYDWFKDSVKVIDAKISEESAPPYYRAYRVVYGVFGKKLYEYDADHPMVLGECVRAVFLAGGGDESVGPRVSALVQKLLVEWRDRRRSDSVLLMWVIKQLPKSWLDVIGGANAGVALAMSRELWSSLSSVPASMFPATSGV